MKAIIISLLLVAGSADPKGTFVLEMRETASALQLLPNGRYQWFFSQGALDATSEGTWTREGETVLLTSDAVVAPRFVFAGARSLGREGVVVEVTAGGRPLQGIDVLLQYQSGRSDVGHTGADGRQRFQLRPGDRAVSIALAEPIFQVRSEDFTLPVKEGQVLSFRLEPNDWGKENFQRLPLRLTSSGVALKWRGATFDYKRQEAP